MVNRYRKTRGARFTLSIWCLFRASTARSDLCLLQK
ncbi:Uncharacterised protein [Vibrio cholerae]|nr:Uncharacterised protein [Vibrio cholerae]